MSSLKQQNTPKAAGCLLKKPAPILKKSSKPLDDALNEVNQCNKNDNNSTEVTGEQPPMKDICGSTIGGQVLHQPRRRPSYIKEKEKRRERWLFTRKTWKYMTDAGRKLIPDGVQNRREDIAKIDAHFQEMCSSEPRFILWRRKSSFPGAARSNSKRRFRQLLQHTGHGKHTLPLTIEQVENEENQNTNELIHLLQRHLKLSSNKTAALLGSNTVRPDQTSSPSAQRPTTDYTYSTNLTSRGPSSSTKGPSQQISEIEQLLERLKDLQRSSTTPIIDIPADRITSDILRDKALLKRVYNSLKKQQLHRILTRHPPYSSKGFSKSLSSLSLSLTSLHSLPSKDLASKKTDRRCIPRYNEKSFPNRSSDSSKSFSKMIGDRRSPPMSLNESKKLSPLEKQRCFNSCGSQTNFIQLNEIKRLAEEYKERKREDATDSTGTENLSKQSLGRRKSSIDNEDVSQSVGDTIKRYLRMARKKSVHGSDANRFKRVNYDRNLRNIRAKGEINPPGMDEGNSKAVQTLDAWALITLDFIRGNENADVLAEAHADWKKDLDERVRIKAEFESKMSGGGHDNKTVKSASSSVPTSPTSSVSTSSNNLEVSSPHSNTGTSSLFHSSTQFLSNIWHGGEHQQDPASSTSDIEDKCMQKSKSTSNIGQIVSRKFLRSRSKSQTRMPSATFTPSDSTWSPADKCTWLSDSGVCLHLNDTLLQNLSDIEAKYMRRVAYEKLNELNVNINDNYDPSGGRDQKQQRVLAKNKKALTTNIFEKGKKEDRVFGNSLEYCLANDFKRSKQQLPLKDRNTGNSAISALFRNGRENVRSCESLPSTANSEISRLASITPDDDIPKKSASMSLSSSMWDMQQRNSMDLENGSGKQQAPPDLSLNVPCFLRSCIKSLEASGLNEVGLFRVSTSKKRIKQLREDINKNFNANILTNSSPHDVATLIKEFLRDMPEPLLCDNLYSAFLKTQKIRNRRLQMEAISHLIKLLPPVHRDTLYALLRFLAKVAAHSDDVIGPDGEVCKNGNKMDSYNLATVFAPNVLRKKCVDGNASLYSRKNTTAMSEQESMNDSICVIRTMIDHYEDLFLVPADLIDVAYSYMLDECPEQLYILCEQQSVSLNSHEAEESQSGMKINRKTQLHSRQSVTHENNATSRAADVAKMDFVDHRKTKRHSDSRQPSRSSSMERRQSSPNVPVKENVISGSLQISAAPKQIIESGDRNFVGSINTKKSGTFKCLPLKDSKEAEFPGPVNEPKLPASISSIGGVLRSKTADFERMTQGGKGLPRQLVKSPSETQRLQAGKHLYKRQQLISSSKGFDLP